MLKKAAIWAHISLVMFLCLFDRICFVTMQMILSTPGGRNQPTVLPYGLPHNIIVVLALKTSDIIIIMIIKFLICIAYSYKATFW